MRYLSLYGSEGFRTFRGILNGKNTYVPEKIAKIDPEILSERDYVLRMQEVIAPYTDVHPKLKEILPVVSSHIGKLHSISDNCSLWRPKNHLSLLGEHLLASCIEGFMPEELENTFYFEGTKDDLGYAFIEAFNLENKQIFIPQNIITDACIPQQDSKTKIYQYDNKNELLRTQIKNKQKIVCGPQNLVRILGHMVTIVQALHETEICLQRFYNDAVSLVLPADNGEFLLAAFYLAQSELPIKNIYAVSSQHRMLHTFLDKGEFKISDHQDYQQLEISLDRLLFEASRASVVKVVAWKKELTQNGSFRVDSTTLSNIQKKIKTVFASKGNTDSVLKEFQSKIELQETKMSLAGYKISTEIKEHTLVFDLYDPSVLKDEDNNIPVFTG